VNSPLRAGSLLQRDHEGKMAPIKGRRYITVLGASGKSGLPP